MNPKITITVDAKNKAIATISGMATVGAKIDVEIVGLPSGIPNWATSDDFYGPSLRFRVVDEGGRDLVRFPLVKKSAAAATDGDQWTKTTQSGADTYANASGTSVEFDTDAMRKEFAHVAFNDYREFGIILDSIVDDAQYAVGKVKIRQWATASTEDPTVLPDWRETLAKLTNDLAAVEVSNTAAAASATAAGQSATSASASASGASQSANAALGHENGAIAAKNAAESASTTAQTAASHYPYVDANGHWKVWENGVWVDKGPAKGDKGDKGDPGEDGSQVSVSATGTSTDEVQYITIDGVEKKLAGGGGSSVVLDTSFPAQEPASETGHGATLKAIWTWVMSKLPTWATLLPSGGIPSTDLSSSVQTSLGKADTALQSHQDISGKSDKGTVTTANAPAYSTSKTYTVGDFVTKDAHLYRCKTEGTTGAWDTTKWDDVTGDLAKTAEAIGATASFVPMFADNNGTRTAATIGTRKTESVYGFYSLANGVNLCAKAIAHAEGSSTQALAYNAHSEGEETKAIGEDSHAEGYKTEAIGFASHASGVKARTGEPNTYGDSYAYSWNGNNEGYYTSHGDGTYNLNPVGCLGGFYVGEAPLNMQLLLDNTAAYSTTSAYAVGAFCRYNGVLYVCKTAITSPGEAWTAAHWTAMPNVSSLFSGDNASLVNVCKEYGGTQIKQDDQGNFYYEVED